MIGEFGQAKVVRQVTLEVTSNAGVKKTIRIDNLAFDDITGKYILGDAKFTTKTKDWNTDWLSSCTENQSIVYPWFKSGDIKEIVVKATDPDKIQLLKDNLKLAPDAKIDFSKSKLKLYCSSADQQVIGQVISLK
ncbi:MAG: hypothetical protein ING84_12270 [Cytophagales bacterium]|nr:hypothetical protein [Cytophagales bacterium]